MSDCILRLENVCKSFGQVTALKNARFELKKGEVHALMGENGAGKSTFIKVITGALKPDSGTVFLDGKEIKLKNTVESAKLGIAAIYQHATSFPDLSVMENIFMGQELLTRFGTYDRKKMKQLARQYLAPFAPDVDVLSPMSSLGVAQQQMVEIAKALSRNARILILDEPTASLTAHECEKLYNIVDELRDKGVSMIFITHRFEDMYRLATRVTVLRDAQYIGTWGINEISNSDLIKAMVGRELSQLYPPKTAEIKETVLSLENLSNEGYFKNVSFSVRAGEVFVLTGLVGSGRSEVCETVFGVKRHYTGKILLDGKELFIKNQTYAIKAGIGLLPEDRLLKGFADRLPIFENVTVANLAPFTKCGLISKKLQKEKALELCNRIRLKAKRIEDAPLTLSGGNQQKVVFAKLLNCELKVLILDEPTKGVDVGAKYAIYEIINELAASGYAIIMVSSEMPEVLGMADRIAVMRNGRIAATFDVKDATQEKILAASLLSEEKGERKE